MPVRDSSLIIRMVSSGGTRIRRAQKTHDSPSVQRMARSTSPPEVFR